MSWAARFDRVLPPTWLERWHRFRDERLTSSSFREQAAALPIGRWVARRRAKALFDLCGGFVYAQILQACVRLRLFDHLAEGPRTAPEIAGRLALSTDAADRLLAAATSLRLAERRPGGRFGLGPLGAALVENPGVAAMIEHHRLLYDDLRDPVALLRGETEPRLRRYWAYAGAASPERIGTDAVAPYSDLMAASQPLVAAELLAAYPFQRHRTLLDLAGGDGRFLVEVGRRHPGLQLLLFDLPPVAAAAARRFEAEGLGGRARAVGGDLRTGPLPAGADLISLVRVIHDHDDEAALVILRAARGALAQGGTLLLAEPMAGTPGAETLEAYFAFYLLAMGQGRPRSADALQALLRAAGFGAVRPIATRMPLVTSLLAAHA